MRSTAITPRARLLLSLLPLVLLLTAACGAVAKPEGWSAPTLKDDVLYVSLQAGTLLASKASDRSRLWQFPAKDQKVRLTVENGRTLDQPKEIKPKFEGIYGDPVVESDGVYATAYSGHVLAIDREGGSRWVAELPGRMVGGVLVDGDTVYAGSTSGELFALARDSGAVRWRRPVDGGIWSTPVLASDRVVVTTMAGRVIAVGRDGTVAWDEKPAGAAIASTPLLVGNRLYVGSFDRRMYALDTGSGQVQWQSPTADNWFWTRPLAAGDLIYAGSLGGTVFAYEAASGAIRWQRDIADTVRSRPVIVNGVLIVGSKDGRLHGLRPDTGEPVWEMPRQPAADDPAAPRGDLYADLLATPNGVYVATERGRSTGRLYLLDVEQRRVSEAPLN